MNAVATAITELVLYDGRLPRLVNVSHPRPVAWKDVFAHVNANLSGNSLNTVSFAQWLQAVEAQSSQDSAKDLSRIVRNLSMSCFISR
jgi:hypothetical protein